MILDACHLAHARRLSISHARQSQHSRFASRLQTFRLCRLSAGIDLSCAAHVFTLGHAPVLKQTLTRLSLVLEQAPRCLPSGSACFTCLADF